ncbi:MAG: DNRLRE domain-containing protein [Planctomycetia bacterium]|nr:DNRLRE domain-containing protein [Planctomycetia bacterium]
MPPRTRHPPRSLPLLRLGLSLAGCGGGGGAPPPAPLPPPIPVVVDVPAVPEIEGYVIGNSVVQGAIHVVVGDNAVGQTFVAFLAFDLTGIGAVTDAVLHFEPGTGSGDPYAFGDVSLDHVDAGAALDLADVAGGTLTADALTFADAPLWDLDVTALVAADVLAGRDTVTFRLRLPLATDGDAENDYARFFSSDHANVAARPRLTVTHTP